MDDPMICIATRTRLSELSGATPVLVVVDDVRRLDPGSLHVLSFFSRPIDDDRLCLPAGARGSIPRDFDHAGRALDVQPALPRGRPRAAVLDQSGGNPLTLVELADGVPGPIHPPRRRDSAGCGRSIQ